MGFWSVAAPIATVGSAFIPGVGPGISMGIGAATGALAANERNNEMEAKARASRNRAADAISASWARKNGRGDIPSIFENNESASGNLLAGTLGGAMQGYKTNKDVNPKDLFTSDNAVGEGKLYGGSGQLGSKTASQDIQNMMYPEANSSGIDWMAMTNQSPQAAQASFSNPAGFDQAANPSDYSLGIDYSRLGRGYKPRM